MIFHEKLIFLKGINSCHYVIGDKLNEGAFGSVYEGSRLLDDFKVPFLLTISS